MRYRVLIFALIFFHFLACRKEKATEIKQEISQSPSVASPAPKFDSNRGKGKWNEENLAIGNVLDQPLAIKGEKLFVLKCSSCHKLSNDKLVGPGFKGLVERRSPEWIMNFLYQPS